MSQYEYLSSAHNRNGYDAFLLVSFGGPEGMADVMPFLDNVLRGKDVPLSRKEAVAQHYERFGGVSPINEQNRKLIAALKPIIEFDGPKLPIYWGNRNWQPMLADTVQQMADDGIKKALAFVTAAYSSYSSCRQYCEDICQAQTIVGAKAPQIDKIRPFYNHPGWVEANAQNLLRALKTIPAERRQSAHIAFTAHSIPATMAAGCAYQDQLLETCRLVIAAAGGQEHWQLAYQSRSGPPSQSWLEPDILKHIQSLKEKCVSDLVIAPIGFISDHMEIIYDLDTEAKQLCAALNINMVRATTAGAHPQFLKMVRKLVEEHTEARQPRLAVQEQGASHDFCAVNCCPSGRQ